MTPITQLAIESLGFKHAGNGLHYLPYSDPRLTVMLYADGHTTVEVTDFEDGERVAMSKVTTVERLRMLVAAIANDK